MMRGRQVPLMATGLILLAVASAGCQGTTEAPSPTEASSTVTPAEGRLRVLEQIDAILSGEYVFPERKGPAWENGLASLRGEVHAGLEDEPYTQALLQLLQSLPQGTVSYATRAERIQAAMGAGGARPDRDAGPGDPQADEAGGVPGGKPGARGPGERLPGGSRRLVWGPTIRSPGDPLDRPGSIGRSHFPQRITPSPARALTCG